MASNIEFATAGYEECISITRWTTKAVGLWPLEETVILPSCKLALVLVLLVFTLIIPQTRKVVKVHDDFNLMLEVLTTALINYTIAPLKVLTMWYYKIDFKKLLAQIHKDWQKTSVEERLKMRRYSKMSRYMLVLVAGGPIGCAFVYIIGFAVSFKSNIIYVNETCIRPLYVLSDFPFDVQQTPIYEIIVFCQCIGAFLAVTAFSAYDCLYISSVQHFSGQLHNLQYRLKNLVSEHQRKKLPFVKCLDAVIKKHLHLVRHAEIIENVFNKEFLVQVLGTSIALCLQGNQFAMIVTETDIAAQATLIFIIVFTLANLASIFMYCLNAQMLRDESEALFYATYQMSWYHMPPKEAVMTVFMMRRFAKPLEITAGKFAPFTLQYFTKIVKTSAGYLSVLLAVQDKYTK